VRRACRGLEQERRRSSPALGLTRPSRSRCAGSPRVRLLPQTAFPASSIERSGNDERRMTRAPSRRTISTALLIGLPVALSCSAPVGNVPPRPGDGVTIVAQPTDGWDKPCSLPEGTQFAASLDRELGTRSSTAGEIFTAHVSWPVQTCERDV